MALDTTVNLSLIFSIVSMMGVLVNIFGTYKHDNEAETKKQMDIEKNFVKINVKLDEFCSNMNDLMRKSEKNMDVVNDISKEIIKQNERIETLFHYHDNHEERLKELEEKVK